MCYSLKSQTAFFDQSFMSYGNYWVLDKETQISAGFENIFFKKQKFPQSPWSIKKYSSEYNGCRFVVKYIYQKLQVGTYQ